MEQKRTRVTRKDIAREAGVSETIVSYVMNNNRLKRKETESYHLNHGSDHNRTFQPAIKRIGKKCV